MIARVRALSGAPIATSAGLLLLAAAAWVALSGAMMTPLGGLMMPSDPNWRAANFAAVYLMWALMMAAMMLPSATPMVMTYATLSRKSGASRDRVALFIAGYLLVWAGFSIAATAVHWALHSSGHLSPMGSSTHHAITGALLMLAGVFQFTPLKRVCLLHCRTPLGFLMTEWRDGARARWSWACATDRFASAAAGR